MQQAIEHYDRALAAGLRALESARAGDMESAEKLAEEFSSLTARALSSLSTPASRQGSDEEIVRVRDLMANLVRTNNELCPLLAAHSQELKEIVLEKALKKGVSKFYRTSGSRRENRPGLAAKLEP